MRNVGRSEALAAAAGPALGRTLEIKQLDVCDEGSIRACLDSIPGRHVDVLGEPRGSPPTVTPVWGPSMMGTPVLGAVQASLSCAGDHLCPQQGDPPCQGHRMTLTPCRGTVHARNPLPQRPSVLGHSLYQGPSKLRTSHSGDPRSTGEPLCQGRGPSCTRDPMTPHTSDPLYPAHPGHPMLGTLRTRGTPCPGCGIPLPRARPTDAPCPQSAMPGWAWRDPWSARAWRPCRASWTPTSSASSAWSRRCCPT